ncbi:hypothetical protein ABZ801_00695 [Actinomadura sp. NPDC047616]|uniref:hypothetical protein n=1 Tax=Actinomadura sp. NPDC047616 TaxID=3155914 RepID=UPI0033E12AFE
MGFTTGIVVAVTVASAVTLLPAVLGFGAGGCCAGATAPPGGGRSPWSRRACRGGADGVARRPWVCVSGKNSPVRRRS